MICVPLTGKTTEEMLAGARQAAKAGADCVEYRVDYMDRPDVAALVGKGPLPEIVTCRPKREEGNFAGDESARIAILQKAVDLGADYVDVEYGSVKKVRPHRPTKLIVSVHDYIRTEENLPRLHLRLAATGADIVKIATTARDIRDNLRLFELLAGASVPTIALAMGERGVISRILAPKFGGYLTFASLEAGKESAAGQLTIAELLGLYRYREINRDTELFGVVANPVAHSMSPAIHNAAFRHLGMNRLYLPFLVDDVTDFLARFRGVVKGFSITIPHKEAACPSADEIDPLSRRIGAINTLVERDGRLIGTNTDLPAAIGAIEAALCGTGIPACPSPLKGKKAAVLGARGTARAIVAGLVDAGAEVKIYNRTPDRARALAEEFGASWASLNAVAEVRDADVLVNTTPLGMWPKVDASPVSADLLSKNMLVFDAVYNPIETKLLREARERGATCVSGIEMFVRQAARQFELFTRNPAPIDKMREAVLGKLSGEPR